MKRQVDLFGLDVIVCKKCSRCFGTMKESSRHHATTHRKVTTVKTSINFTLENFCLISEKIPVKTNFTYQKVRGGEIQ